MKLKPGGKKYYIPINSSKTRSIPQKSLVKLKKSTQCLWFDRKNEKKEFYEEKQNKNAHTI